VLWESTKLPEAGCVGSLKAVYARLRSRPTNLCLNKLRTTVSRGSLGWWIDEERS
jgi:hypothetical protein